MSTYSKVQVGISVSTEQLEQDIAKTKAIFEELPKSMAEKALRAGKSFDNIALSARKAGVDLNEYINTLATTGVTIEESARKQENATKRFTDAITRQTIALKAGGKATADYLEQTAYMKGADPKVIAPLADELRKIEAAQKLANAATMQGTKQLNEYGMSAKATAAALRSVPAQFTDIVVSLQGGQAPLTVLLQQGGQLKDMFGGIGGAARALGGYIASLVNPFTLAAAAAGGLYLAYESGQKSVREFNKLLIDTNNAVGYTTNQLLGMSEALSSQGFSRNDAAVAISTIAKSSLVATTNLKEFTKIALDLEKYVGVPIEKTAQAFAKMAEEPSKAAKSMSGLTVAQYELVKSLEETGNKTEAAKIVMNAFGEDSKRVIAGYKADMDALDVAASFWTEKFKLMWDAISGTTMADTAAVRIDNLKKKIAELSGPNPFKNVGLVDAAKASIDPEGTKARLIAQYSEELNYITRINQEMERSAKARKDEEEIKSKGKSAIDALTSANDKYASSQQKANKELEDYRRNIEALRKSAPNSELLNPATIRRTEQGIMAKAEDKSNDAIKNQIASLKARVNAEEEYLGRLVIQGDLADKLTEGEKEVLKIQEMILKSKNEQEKAGLRIAEGVAKELAVVQQQIQERKNAVELGKDERRKALESAKGDLSEFTQSMRDIDISKMNGMFNGAIDGALKFATALNTVVETQTGLAKALEANKIVNAGDAAKMAKTEAELIRKAEDATINSYGNMAAGLKSYAKEGTKAYDALYNAEKIFRAFELASAVSNMATKSGLVDFFVAKKVAGDALMTTSATASASAEVAANAAVGSSNAIVGVTNQSKGDPYTAFPRMAAMAAIMASLGFAVGAFGGGSGGGAAPTNSGTGTVLGDSSAKSESLKNSLDILNSTQDIALDFTKQMAQSLKTIESNIGGLTNIYLRTGGASGLESTIATGKFDTALSKTVATVTNFAIGVMNPLVAVADFLLGGGKMSGGPITGAVNKVSQALFGSSTSITGSGILANKQTLADIGELGFQGNYYADVQTKKKFLGMTTSTSNSTLLNALDPVLEQQFGAVFTGIGKAVSSAADLLGQDTAATNKRLQEFIVDIGRIDLKGLTGAQVTEKLSAVFGQQADLIAQAVVPGFEKLQMVGEGYSETLSRVALEFELVRTYAERLGDTFSATGVAGGALADTIVQAFGGIEAYQSSIQQYYEDFFTEEERNAQSMTELTRAFGRLNLALPTTIEGYKALVNAQDTNTESGLLAYRSLIQLSGAFADLTSSAKDAADELYSNAQDATDLAFDAVKRSIDAASKSAEKSITDAYEAASNVLKGQKDLATTAAQVAQENVNAFKGVFDLLKTEIESLIGDTTASMSALKGRQFIEQSIATAQATGYLPEKEQLSQAISAVKTGMEKTAYSSAFEQQRDRLVLANRLGVLKEVAGEQLTTAELQLKASQDQVKLLEEQISQAKTKFDTDIETNRKYYSDALDAAQSQLDVLRGIDASILSVSDAMSKLASAISSEVNVNPAAQVAATQQQPATMSSSSIVQQAYASIGRVGIGTDINTIDQAGYDYWKNAIDTGAVSASNFSSVFNNAVDEYVKAKPEDPYSVYVKSIRGYASGGFYKGGMALVGEQGPEIINFKNPGQVYTAGQTDSLLGGGQAMIEEVRGLREDNQAQARAMVQLQAKMNKLMERWDSDGLPEVRAVA
jgi:phage-related minor tail protein